MSFPLRCLGVAEPTHDANRTEKPGLGNKAWFPYLQSGGNAMAASTLPVRPDYLLNLIDKSDLPRERVRKLGVGALKNEEPSTSRK